MNFFTKTPLGTDAQAVTDNQHADHEFGINRGPTEMAVIGLQRRPDFAQIQKRIDPAQHMIFRDMIFQAEIVKQLLRSYLRSQHQAVLQSNSLKKMESQTDEPSQRLLQQNQHEPQVGKLYCDVRSTYQQRTMWRSPAIISKPRRP